MIQLHDSICQVFILSNKIFRISETSRDIFGDKSSVMKVWSTWL